MEFAIILLTFGLDIILPILGIVGYFAPAYWLLNISFLFIIGSTFFKHLSPFTVIIHIISCISLIVLKKIKITFEENTEKKNKYKKYPRLDLDRLAFEDEETVEQMQIDYIKAIKKKVLKRWLAPMILIFIAFAVVIYLLAV